MDTRASQEVSIVVPVRVNLTSALVDNWPHSRQGGETLNANKKTAVPVRTAKKSVYNEKIRRPLNLLNPRR